MTKQLTTLQATALSLVLAQLVSLPLCAEEPPKPDFEFYQLVLLRRGPKATKEVTPESEKIQEQHLAHLTKMADAGHLVIAGPFGDQQDQTLRGMCLYRVGSVDEARKLAEQDPAVVAGRLRVEVLTWWVEKGYMTFPKAPAAAKP